MDFHQTWYMCIDIVEIWFGIANGQILSNFDGVICPRRPYFCFQDDNLNKCQGILTKFGTCIDRKEIWFGIAYGFHQCLTFICPLHNNGGVL